MEYWEPNFKAKPGPKPGHAPHAKLTAHDRDLILALRLDHAMRVVEIAEKFEVSRRQIYRILNQAARAT